MYNQLVSVVVPSYNYDKYIFECLESIAKQNYKNIELIIVDDCSKDQSLKVIEKFINKYKKMNRFHRIEFIKHFKNQGAHYTINEGIELATGKYIAVINADDLYEQNRFSSMIPYMENEKKQIAFSSIEIINDKSELAKGQEADNFRAIQKRIEETGEVWKALIIQNVAISTGNLIFTKQLYKNLKGFKEYKYIHDWDFILRATLIDEPLYIKETKYFYRLHTTNSFRELGSIADQEVNEVLTNFFNEIKKNKIDNPKITKLQVEQMIKDTYLMKYWKQNRLKEIIKKLFLK